MLNYFEENSSSTNGILKNTHRHNSSVDKKPIVAVRYRKDWVSHFSVFINYLVFCQLKYFFKVLRSHS